MSAKVNTKKTTAAKKAPAKKIVAKKAKVVKKDKVNDEVREGGLGQKPTVIRKKFEGVVVSDAMDKTVVVRIDSVKVHSKYMKRFSVSKKYKVHDEKNQFKVDDKVTFVECRPLSKDKRWRVIYS